MDAKPGSQEAALIKAAYEGHKDIDWKPRSVPKGFSILFLFLSLYASFAYADDCQLVEVVGMVRIEENHFSLSIAEETRSATKITVPILLQSDFAPYINQAVVTTLVVDKDLVIDKDLIKGVNSVDRTFVDPLNQGGWNTVRLKGNVQCPDDAFLKVSLNSEEGKRCEGRACEKGLNYVLP